MDLVKAGYTLLADALNAWWRNKGSLYAAAIAYYMVFSIAPLLVFSIAIAGRVFSQAAIEGEIVTSAKDFIGPEAALLLQNLVRDATNGSSSFTIISSIFLLWAASGIFNHLKRALDIIYGVIPRQLPPAHGFLHWMRTRFLTFAMVLFMGLLLIMALALNTVAATMGTLLARYLPEMVAVNSYVTKIVTPAIMFILFSMVFKLLPDVHIAWRDVWLGAAVTTLLVALGSYAISLYLQVASVGSVYGAAGSLIVVLVWFYYSAQILMFGAEFTKLYAIRYGGGIEPRSRAMTLAKYYADMEQQYGLNGNALEEIGREEDTPSTNGQENTAVKAGPLSTLLASLRSQIRDIR
jgi:membrane protein